METTTLTNDQMKDETVIAKLNQKITNKKIKTFYVFNHAFLKISLEPNQNNEMTLEKYESFLSITDFKPYLHIMIPYNEFTNIEFKEVN